MKKYVLVLNAIELFEKILNGRRVEGVLFIDKDTGKLTFKAYNRPFGHRRRDDLLKKTPWGWLKGSITRYKRYSSIPKDLSLPEQLAIFDEENELMKQALIDHHIIESI